MINGREKNIEKFQAKLNIMFALAMAVPQLSIENRCANAGKKTTIYGNMQPKSNSDDSKLLFVLNRKPTELI